MELEKATDEAIDTCKRDDNLQDFFRTYKNEVSRIMVLDFIFERTEQDDKDGALSGGLCK